MSAKRALEAAVRNFKLEKTISEIDPRHRAEYRRLSRRSCWSGWHQFYTNNGAKLVMPKWEMQRRRRLRELRLRQHKPNTPQIAQVLTSGEMS